MKTSNKILLAILICGFGFLTYSQVILHFKFANNDFIAAEKYNAGFYDEYIMPDLKHINIRGLAEFKITPSNTVKLSVEKSNISTIHYKISGDTLYINGEYGAGYPATLRPVRSTQHVKLSLPAGKEIYAIRSNIDVQGIPISTGTYSYYFNLDNSNLFSRQYYYVDSVNRYFDKLTINAQNKSRVSLFHNDHFKNLAVQLDQSLINDFSAKIDTATIVPDSTSTIVISGQNIHKLNAIAIKN